MDASSVATAILASWRIDVLLTTTLALVGIIYFRGWRRLHHLHDTLLPRWRLVCFTAGLTSLWLAAVSPLDTLASLLLTAHMTQHLVLMAVAPPLILLGAPIVPMLRGLPRWFVRDTIGPFLTWPALRRFAHSLTHPGVGLLAMAAAMWGWHLPGPYQLALREPFWHDVEHATFVAGPLLFWWSVVRPWPFTPHWSAWSIAPTLLLADLQNTAIAAIFTFSDRVLYPVYDQVPRLGGLSALDDQVMAGVVMWVPGSLAFLVPAIVVTVRLLSPTLHRRSKTAPTLRRSNGRSAPVDLLATPLIGAFLRGRHGRRVLQGALLVLALAVVADGLMGDQMSAMNLAGVLPWTYWRFFVVVGLLAVGNVFCMACPFMLPRELGRRLGLATRQWPRPLRSKWLAVGLLALFFWAYEALALWNRPIWTAWIIVAYFVAAFLVDTLFRGASFCKYVCPIGQFQFVTSLVSPFEVRLKERSVCATCVTHDCLRGNAQQRGCELDLYIPRKVGNMDCTFCLDCVRACPHDNVGVLATAPGSDLWNDRLRSSIGRFSRRPDIAAAALVVVVGGFAGAAVMVQPLWVRSPSTFVATTIMTALAAACVMLATVGPAPRRLARRMASFRGLACRLSLTLVPLGLAMWAGHSLFHFVTGWSTAWPTARRAAIDAGISGFGEPRWTAMPALLGADSVLTFQLLLLDAGLLLTLYAGWRIMRAATTRSSATIALQLSWAVLAVVLYAGGVWTFLQPMPMRGMVH